MAKIKHPLTGVVKLILFALIFSGCQKTFDTIQPSINSESSEEARNKKPNIIFILGDDIGYEAMSFNGGETFYTPYADLLAKQSLRFTGVYAAPLSSPSRFMAFTGKYIFRNYTQWGHMDTTNRTIANLLRDNGYNTCFAGKWQLDGGDPAIKALGFNAYCAFNVGKIPGDEEGRGSQYKNPKIYQDGAFLPDSITKDKYGDDFFAKYVTDFMENNDKNQPFFVFYATGLAHSPFGPTPDDLEFMSWDGETSDATFFPSMVTYQDKKIGEILKKVHNLGIERNTVIICIQGDNGTANGIKYVYEGEELIGKKGKSNKFGTHVPMLISFPRFIKGVNNDLIAFTDFMPTIADMIGVPVPTSYGIMDGVSFFPRLLGLQGTPRSWIFTQTELQWPVPDKQLTKRFVFDYEYKLYDSTDRFYNIVLDANEKKPLKYNNLTQEEKDKRDFFRNILDSLHN